MELLNSPDFVAHVENLQGKWHVPGLAIAIVQNETTVSRGFGKASLDPPRACVPDTLFDVASCSKSLTAAAVALFIADDVEYPHVQWETTMSSLLPDDFVMSGAGYTENVNVEDVLSHRTGLPSHDSSYLGPRAMHPDTPRSVTRNIRNLQVSTPIRSRFIYCNLLYTAASYLVEQLGGLSFSDFLRTRFFDPIGMSSTNLQPSSAKAAGLGDSMATPYMWLEDSHTYIPIDLQQAPEAQGAGSIISSVNDYIKWVKTVMNQEAPITEAIYKGLIKPRTFVNPDDDDLDPHTSWEAYAAGWWPRYYRGQLVVLHEGSTSGFGSIHFFLPNHKSGGVILGNSSDASELAPVVAHELIDEALKFPVDDRPDWDALYTQRKEGDSKEEHEKALAKIICPDHDGTPQPQKIPLNAYTGEYWNAGYHGIVLGTKDGRLFVDATDRSMGFFLTFDHICDQTKYVAHLEDSSEGGDDPLMAEFRFENGRVVKMGLALESDLDCLIWFDKVDSVVSDNLEDRAVHS